MRTVCATLMLTLVWLRPAAVDARPRLGVELGLQDARLDYASRIEGFDLDPDRRWAPIAGVTATWPLSDRLAIDTGLRYSEIREVLHITFGDSATVFAFTSRTTLRYLSVPVRLVVRPFESRRLTFAAGPELGWLVAARRRFESNSSGGFTSAAPRARPAAQIFEDVGTFDENVHDEFHAFDLALGGAVALAFPAGTHALTVQVRYAHGVTEALKRSGDVSRHTEALAGSLGWRW